MIILYEPSEMTIAAIPTLLRLRHNARRTLCVIEEHLMSRFSNAGRLALLLFLLSPRSTKAQDVTPQEPDIRTAKRTEEEAIRRSTLVKPHFANGNQAVQEAQAIRQQVQSAPSDQKPSMLAKMKSDYENAITEYQLALQDAGVRDENGVRVIGLIGIIRNGLVSQQKAVEMLVQDKDMPVLLTNLGIAYGGAGRYEDAITILQEAVVLKAAATTYMELGTDLAQLGKVQEATAACDKIAVVDSAAKNAQAGCYKNVAIVLTNHGKLADAISPLLKAVQLSPQDALGWKLLGDALTNTITSTSQNGNIIYIVPPGTIEAYKRYLQLEPNGPYAGQVKAALEGLAQLSKGAATQTKETN